MNTILWKKTLEGKLWILTHFAWHSHISVRPVNFSSKICQQKEAAEIGMSLVWYSLYSWSQYSKSTISFQFYFLHILNEKLNTLSSFYQQTVNVYFILIHAWDWWVITRTVDRWCGIYTMFWCEIHGFMCVCVCVILPSEKHRGYLREPQGISEPIQISLPRLASYKLYKPTS